MATDTLAFIVKHAELFILTCWKCGHVVKMTPDDIRAKANRGLEEERFSFQNRSRCTKCGMRCPKHETIWKSKNIRIGSYGHRNPNGSIRDR